MSVTPLPSFATPPRGGLQEKPLERLRPSDRSSLLSEMQALRAQLRMAHLQNQEKLQQLCAALTSAEARGSRQEHQLRRQGERRPPGLSGSLGVGTFRLGISWFAEPQRTDSVVPPEHWGAGIRVSAGRPRAASGSLWGLYLFTLI